MNDLPVRSPIRSLPQSLPSGNSSSFHMPMEDSGNEAPLREYFKVIVKYRVLIAACTAVCGLLALLYAFTVTPLYTAESTVRISTYEPVLTSTKIEDMLQERSRESNYLETQIQEMKSFSLADQVLQDEKIRSGLDKSSDLGFFSQLFANGGEEVKEPADQLSEYKNPIKTIKKYLKSIEIKPVRRTSLVAIEVTTESAPLAALISNRHALTYMDWVRENRVEQQARGLTFLRAQADELREKVADLERELTDYAEANSIVALNKDENITAQKMSQLNRLLTDSTAKRIETENMFREAEAGLRNPSAGFDDTSTQQMRSELARMESEYQQLSTKFTPNYPKVQQLRSQVEDLKRSIEGQRKQIVNGLKAKWLAAQQEEKNLHEELEQQKSQAFELSKRQVQYNVLNRELTSSRDLLQNVLRQIKETSLAVESNASNVSVVDYAVVPQIPSFPKKKIMLVVGLFIGLGIGVSLALLLKYLDNTVRTPEDLTQLLRIPSLGVVPSFELEMLPSAQGDSLAGSGSFEGATKETVTGEPSTDLPASRDNSPVMFVADPRSLASEAYRTIRTGILLSQAGEPPRTILVSSAQSSEGKTTSSINLAASLASAGGRVVLIDADLRRPSVHKHFGLSGNDAGLVEVITGHARIADVAIKDLIKRVSIITSGKIPPNPAELLGSLEMASIIDELSNSFDYVIIDSPPVLPVTDSVILSRYVDGVVLVVRGASTPRKVVKDAKDRLQSVGARFLGAILNDVDIRGGDYYYYNRYYHSYYQQDGNSTSSRRSDRTRKRAAGA